jgi:MFS family permease
MTIDGGSAAPPPWREVFAGARGRLTAGLLMLEAVAAMEALVVATILPAVREELGDVQLYGWAFSAYSLAAFGTIPLSGRAVDRYGARRPLAVMLSVYALGLLVAALAPSMPVLVLGRFIQGTGAGGLYSVSIGAVAKTYPDRLRPRVLALMASMWILPGLFGPPLGALLASTVGWRWAFLAPLPALFAASVLVFPSLGRTRAEPSEVAALPVRWPLQLMVGVGMVLSGLTDPSWWSPLLIAAGLGVGLPALLKIVPKGTLRARPGLPAAAAAAFLLSTTFGAADGFIPLMLTGVRDISVGRAGLVVTVGAFAWAAGSWWQSRRAGTWSATRLVALGASLIAFGTIVVAIGIEDAVPVLVIYGGWLVAALGMGIAFPTIPFAVMHEAGDRDGASEISATLLMDVLGWGIGAGLGGSCIAVAQAAGFSLRTGLIGTFTIAVLTAVTLLSIARRLPSGRS